ncbi:MAG: endonuclease III [candidate division WOR-3 bacterium]|nr:endonuclease III [candidate division WOR-3 bacterium]
MDTETIVKVLKILKKEYRKWKDPIVTEIAKSTRDPFRILISTVLSARTKDAVTRESSRKLFLRASTPREMANLEPREIEQLIYPVGFYKTKAKKIPKIAEILMEKFDGRVPDRIDQLLELPGVGRKTANLVVTLGFGKPGICVDTHVHRISNRFGYVKTKAPEETEFALKKKLPEEWWIIYNDLLVTLGQNICLPRKPKCGKCVVENFCEKKFNSIKPSNSFLTVDNF